MTQQKSPRAGDTANAGVKNALHHDLSENPEAVQRQILVDTLLAIIDGSDFANFMAPWGKPAPCRLPANPSERRALVQAHVDGKPAEVLCSVQNQPERIVQANPLVLAAFNPGSDGLVHNLSVDLDAAAGHGDGGLKKPAHALQVFAERCDVMGLTPGLLAATSKSGAGRHLWIILPSPTPLIDAVVGLAALVAAALRVAAADVADYGGEHAFKTADGGIAEPGRAGQVELYPRRDTAPRLGWPLTLPAAGCFRERGGGIIVNPFTGRPTTLAAVPRCPTRAWEILVRDARLERARRQRPAAQPIRAHRRRAYRGDPLARISDRTKAFLDGLVGAGSRNNECYSAAANMLGVGVDRAQAEQLLVIGAERCGLPISEVRAAIRSASNRRASA